MKIFYHYVFFKDQSFSLVLIEITSCQLPVVLVLIFYTGYCHSLQRYKVGFVWKILALHTVAALPGKVRRNSRIANVSRYNVSKIDVAHHWLTIVGNYYLFVNITRFDFQPRCKLFLFYSSRPSCRSFSNEVFGSA